MQPKILRINKDEIDLLTLHDIIEFFGNQTILADKLGIANQYVCAWCHRRYHMPIKYAKKIEKLTNGKFTVESMKIGKI